MKLLFCTLKGSTQLTAIYYLQIARQMQEEFENVHLNLVEDDDEDEGEVAVANVPDQSLDGSPRPLPPHFLTSTPHAAAGIAVAAAAVTGLSLDERHLREEGEDDHDTPVRATEKRYLAASKTFLLGILKRT